MLEPGVFVLQLLQAARLGDIHAAVLLTPAVERVCADAVPAAQITRLGTGIGLRQDGDDLLFRKPALPHDSSLAKESHYNCIRFRWAGHGVFGLRHYSVHRYAREPRHAPADMRPAAYQMKFWRPQTPHSTRRRSDLRSIRKRRPQPGQM